MLKRFYILCLFLMYVSVLKAQVSLGGGLNSVAAIGIKNPYLGMNLLGEYRQDDLSYFVKYFTSLPQTDSQVLIPMDELYNVLDSDESISKKYYLKKLTSAE